MRSFQRGRVAFFVSGNVHKFNEARLVLAKYGIATALIKAKAPEIQDDSVLNIAKASAIEAVKKFNLPVFVEDSGLFIKALNGFPGPYSSYVYRKIGIKGILKLMENVEKRQAFFHSAVVFCSPNDSPKTFFGKSDGIILFSERGSSGFGFDPVFAPLGGGDRTFAQMTIDEKNFFSHRAQAMQNFAKDYSSS